MESLRGDVAESYRQGIADARSDMARGAISKKDARLYATMPLTLAFPFSAGLFTWLWQREEWTIGWSLLLAILAYALSVFLMAMIVVYIVAQKTDRSRSSSLRPN